VRAANHGCAMIAYVDVNDICQLHCPTCLKGMRIQENSNETMPLGMFRAICLKLAEEGYRIVGLYNWTEPFLNMRVHEYIRIVKAVGLECDISSNFSFANRFPVIRESLRAGLDRLIVSVSGFDQAVYEINHRSGRIAWVKKNLELVSDLLLHEKTIATEVRIKFIKFDYNISQEPLLREYAESLNLEFEIVEGVGHPNFPVKTYMVHDSAVEPNRADISSRLSDYSPVRTHEKPGEICVLPLDTLAIDCKGDVYLCCQYPNLPSLKIGKYLELTADESLISRYTHPICASCNIPRRRMNPADQLRLSQAFESRLKTTHADSGEGPKRVVTR
jgi:hypothetical protein